MENKQFVPHQSEVSSLPCFPSSRSTENIDHNYAGVHTAPLTGIPHIWGIHEEFHVSRYFLYLTMYFPLTSIMILEISYQTQNTGPTYEYLHLHKLVPQLWQ